jgi:DNA polymerase III delta prime subunit
MSELASNALLIEKYRPRRVEDLIDNCLVRDGINLRQIVENPFSMPHMLLHSTSPGTGKSTIVRVLVDALNADYSFIDGSVETGIDVIRGPKVSEFARTLPRNPHAPKIIHIEEADRLTPQAQDALKDKMDKMTGLCRVIITCNRIYRLSDTLVSRCKGATANTSTPDKRRIYTMLMAIRDGEAIDLPAAQIWEIINAFYPDIRSMIHALHSYMTSGTYTLETPRVIANTIYTAILNHQYDASMEPAYRRDIDHRAILHRICDLIYYSDRLPTFKEKLPYLRIIAQTDYEIAMSAKPEIAFLVGVGNLVEV